jgi:hypothetical protein
MEFFCVSKGHIHQLSLVNECLICFDLIGEEIKRLECMLLHIPCRNGGIKRGSIT